MGVMEVMARGEAEVVTWDTPEEATEVAKEFDRLVQEGHLTYKVKEGENLHTRTFDPEAEKMVVTRRLVGG